MLLGKLDRCDAVNPYLFSISEEEPAETEAVPEPTPETIRSRTPEGSESEEQLDDAAADVEESPDEEATVAPPRGCEYLIQLTTAVQHLLTATQQTLSEN